MARHATTLRSLGLAAMLGGVLATPPVGAAPLPPETCEVLKAEMALLEGGGAGFNIERGVDWGKANLSPEQIRYVARLIALREQIIFRCRPALIEMPTPPLPPPPPEPVEAEKMPLPERRQQAGAGGATSVPPAPAEKTAEKSAEKPAVKSSKTGPAAAAAPAVTPANTARQ